MMTRISYGYRLPTPSWLSPRCWKASTLPDEAADGNSRTDLDVVARGVSPSLPSLPAPRALSRSLLRHETTPGAGSATCTRYDTAPAGASAGAVGTTCPL